MPKVRVCVQNYFLTWYAHYIWSSKVQKHYFVILLMKSQDVLLYPHHFFSQQQINSFDWKLLVQLNFCQVCLFFPSSIAEKFFPSISFTDELRNQDILKRIICYMCLNCYELMVSCSSQKWFFHPEVWTYQHQIFNY